MQGRFVKALIKYLGGYTEEEVERYRLSLHDLRVILTKTQEEVAELGKFLKEPKEPEEIKPPIGRVPWYIMKRELERKRRLNVT